jgi:hypothetical protein
MSIKHQTWRWRNRQPCCDRCGSAATQRMRIEIDWKEQMTKMTWQCTACGNHVFVYAHKKQQAA